MCPRLLYQARGLRVVLLLVGYKVQGPSSGRTRRAVIPNPARCYPSSSWSQPDQQSGVDNIFLTRVKEGDFCEEKVADLEETKRCTVLESADGVRPMDQRNMS